MSAISEALLRAVFDGLQEAICVVDAHTHRILFANACAGRLAGQLPRDLTGVPIEHLTASIPCQACGAWMARWCPSSGV